MYGMDSCGGGWFGCFWMVMILDIGVRMWYPEYARTVLMVGLDI